MYEDLRNGLNSIASAQWGLIQMGQGESYTYETLTQRYDALRKTFDDIKEGKLQQDNADLVRQLRNAQASLLAAGIAVCRPSRARGPIRRADETECGA